MEVVELVSHHEGCYSLALPKTLLSHEDKAVNVKVLLMP